MWRAKVRRIIRGPDPIGGIKSVYLNLLRGLDKLGIPYVTNIPYCEIRPSDLVGVIGLGDHCLDGYEKPNPILAGVAVAEHPAAWPSLFEDYPVARYVVHCDWVKAMYERHWPNKIVTWAVGIDTDRWAPAAPADKSVDFLIYDKVMWDRDRVHRALVEPILVELRKRRLSYEVIRYGFYKPEDYASALTRAKGMIFLCEHETQGLAYQQAMSCNVPVLAWDPGAWLDPWRFRYGETCVPATSVPFFDKRCGATFPAWSQFSAALDAFCEQARGGAFKPRDYVLENLTLAGCAEKYLSILRGIP